MKAVKIGILEDDIIIAMALEQDLRDMGYEPAGIATSFSEAEELVDTEQPDLMLVDIRLKGDQRDGIEFAARLRQQRRTPVIFVTANSDAGTVQRAKIAAPAAFLVKPFDKAELYASIEVALYNAGAVNIAAAAPHPAPSPVPADTAIVPSTPSLKRDSLFVRQGQFHQKVAFDDILYLESDNTYLNIQTTTRRLVVRSGLAAYLDYLASDRFFRIHRSFAVNLQQVTALDADFLVVGTHEVPIGKMYRQELMNVLNIA